MEGADHGDCEEVAGQARGRVRARGVCGVGGVAGLGLRRFSTRESKVQAHDRDNGLPLWQVEVLDVDPEANKKGRTVTVKFAAKVQPVPPEALEGLPLRPVEFDGLTALPYVETTGNFNRIAWSFRADAMHAPATLPLPVVRVRPRDGHLNRGP